MLTLQILLGLLVLTCGPVLLWRRRDNVLGYLGAGLFLSTYLIPLAPTLYSRRFDHATLALYADVLLVGGLAFVAGLALGGQVGARSPNRVPLTFSRPLSPRMEALVGTRARWLAAAGLLGLVVAFLTMRYVPLLAADRTSAKFGVGPYRAAFERGAVFYRFGLAASATALPVVLAFCYRRRRPVDLLLTVVLLLGLLLSLSRDSAFTGPFIVAIAVAVERRWRPWVIALSAAAALALGALVSLAFVVPAEGPQAAADRIAASTPDIRDHIGFLHGYELRGERAYGRTLLAGLALEKSDWEPATYALRTLTGFTDFRDFASGGLRLPAPLWGYASFGWPGVIGFSAVSGLFAGWGLVKIRRLLTPSLGKAGCAIPITLSIVFYNGTYRILSEFYFLTSAALVDLAAAVLLGVAVRVVLTHRADRPPPASGTRRSAVGESALR